MTNIFSNFSLYFKNTWTKTKQRFSKTLPSSNVPFMMIKLVFVDIGYHPVSKIINYICLAIYMSSFLLEMNFLRLRFSTHLLIKYGCGSSLSVYFISSMTVAAMTELLAVDLSEGILSSFWPIDFCGPQVKQLILKQSRADKRMHYVVLLVFSITGLAMLPIWGDQKEWFLCVQVYEYNFGEWSKIPYYIYFFTFPWVAFSSLRLPFMMNYAILNLRMQVFLINQKIAKMSNAYDQTTIEDVNSQKRIFKNLRLCISHHILIKWWLRKFVNHVKFCIPIFVIVGIATSISIVFYLIYSFQQVNLVLKIRFLSIACCCWFVIYLFSEAGQSLYEYTEIFHSLISCRWYIWNVKNRRILLVFLANSLEPMTFSLAGITLNYRFALNMMKTSCSYALILYKLNCDSQIMD
ncbi:odorant receptor 205 [Tribolium castaneum]|uniref:Odorant receptor n=1 Tax=Tribolium castaneum TaxID=7070 RepID=D6X3G3_TRICA|nr:odorant receptor 205 [Tribolium castaneum]